MNATQSEGKSAAKQFARRLHQACDDTASVPEYGKGRQVVVANKLEVSQEAARKWFAGESMPKPEKMKKLAEFLEVDRAWLALGEKPELTRDAKKLAGKIVEGSVLLIAGTLQMAGANCAFPSEDDPRKDHIDIYAILRGKKIDLHVSTAKELATGQFEFIVPREYADVQCVGFVPARGVMFHMLDLTRELIDKHKARRSGDFTVTVDRVDGHYITGQDEWPRFKPVGGI